MQDVMKQGTIAEKALMWIAFPLGNAFLSNRNTNNHNEKLFSKCQYPLFYSSRGLIMSDLLLLSAEECNSLQEHVREQGGVKSVSWLITAPTFRTNEVILIASLIITRRPLKCSMEIDGVFSCLRELF